jgi:L-threonylcarbamoyladenylate synthase
MYKIASDEALINGFNTGQLIAYPTEAVYGLGCDPLHEKAVDCLLQLKRRPWQKGMIIVADNVAQIEKWVDFSILDTTQQERVFSTWPGPVTWLLPKTQYVPRWISGESDYVAIRLSAHPEVKRLCRLFESPVVSTSANKSGEDPIKDPQKINTIFENKSILIASGSLGRQTKPSEIRHSISGQVIRASE